MCFFVFVAPLPVSRRNEEGEVWGGGLWVGGVLSGGEGALNGIFFFWQVYGMHHN